MTGVQTCALPIFVNQIEATEDGILRRQLCEEGDTIDALAPVAIVETK